MWVFQHAFEWRTQKEEGNAAREGGASPKKRKRGWYRKKGRDRREPHRGEKTEERGKMPWHETKEEEACPLLHLKNRAYEAHEH